jgi:hypothetical protein
VLQRRHLAARLAKWGDRVGAEATKQFYDGQLLYVGGVLLATLVTFVDLGLEHPRWISEMSVVLLVGVAWPSVLAGWWKIARARRLIRDRYAFPPRAMRTLRLRALNDPKMFDAWLARHEAERTV